MFTHTRLRKEATYSRMEEGEVAFLGWVLWACLAALIMPRQLHLLCLDNRLRFHNRLEVFQPQQ